LLKRAVAIARSRARATAAWTRSGASAAVAPAARRATVRAESTSATPVATDRVPGADEDHIVVPAAEAVAATGGAAKRCPPVAKEKGAATREGVGPQADQVASKVVAAAPPAVAPVKGDAGVARLGETPQNGLRPPSMGCAAAAGGRGPAAAVLVAAAAAPALGPDGRAGSSSNTGR
jgi:hypothetical protein